MRGAHSVKWNQGVAMATVTRRKTGNFFMRVDPRILRAAKEAAAAERRSVASFIERLLEADLSQRGYLTPHRPVKKTGQEEMRHLAYIAVLCLIWTVSFAMIVHALDLAFAGHPEALAWTF